MSKVACNDIFTGGGGMGLGLVRRVRKSSKNHQKNKFLNRASFNHARQVARGRAGKGANV
jgi:hypothetical protein